MHKFTTSIIPTEPIFCGTRKELDLRAVCVFSALGFFLDSDTFWLDQKTLPVASNCEIDDGGKLISSKPYFKWHYNPRAMTLKQAAEEFTELFENIVREQTAGRKVILPLSGGLDSRTQAAALKNIGAQVNAYSYSFENGHNETKYSAQIADAEDFSFQSWTIKPEYLWNVIDDLAAINGCYSEFTHPRQMAFFENYGSLGDVFSLGHWGDVLFDDMGIADDLPPCEQVAVLIKKVVKKGGLELGSALWQSWGLEGSFEDYLFERIKTLHSAVNIPTSANASVRAFKSMFWATRWTSVNLAVFSAVKPITLPYYDRRMCEFICAVPEKHLAGRQIQIEYLKRQAPELAKIAWQDQRPFNLYNYNLNKTPWNIPYRIYDKVKRGANRGQYVQRNWELQFLGERNARQLKKRLFDEPKLTAWIEKDLIEKFYRQFTTENPVYYSHSVSMLLTLSLFSRHFK